VEVRGGEMILFWAAIPHQVIAFEQVDRYYVVTIPLRLAIDWRLPTKLLTPLLHGHFLRDRPSVDNVEARQFGQWCHDFECGDDLSHEAMSLELRGRLLRFASTLPNALNTGHGASARSLDRLDREARSFLFPDADGLAASSAFNLPTEVSASGSATMLHSHKKAETMTRFIAQKFLQKILVADVAKEVGLHEDYAAALFRKTFGMTMVELITHYRVTHTQRLLITTSMPISEDFLDGTSSTIMFGELATDLGDRDARTQAQNGAPNEIGITQNNPLNCQKFVDPLRPRFWLDNISPKNHVGGAWCRGMRWADFYPIYTVVHTILPPNSHICVGLNWANSAQVSPSSQHQGGAHVLMGDGAVKFITDSIEAGNSSAPMVRSGAHPTAFPGAQSPYGLWGAVGTRAVKEVIRSEF